MSRNRWPTVDPSLFREKANGTCDMPTVQQPVKRRSKMNNTLIHDPVYGLFHSKGEHIRWHELLFLEKSGIISGLQRQIPYVLCDAEEIHGLQLPKITYKADFLYVENYRIIVEDFKSTYTRNLKEWRLKKALFILKYPDILLRESLDIELGIKRG